MPKRVVGIVIVVTLAALSGAADAAQQNHATTKTVSQPATQSTSAPSQASTTPTKFTTISRDVCAKHPNLKQCS